MTKARSPTGVGVREAGRQLDVEHSYLLRLAKAQRIPRHGDGTFDVDAVRRALLLITDPRHARDGRKGRWLPPASDVVTSPPKVVTGHSAEVVTNAAVVTPTKRGRKPREVPPPPTEEAPTVAVPPVTSIEAARQAVNLVAQVLREEGVAASESPRDDARTAEMILKVRERHLRIELTSRSKVDLAESERRWSADIMKLRARMLAVPASIGAKLSNLSRAEIATIDRVVRDAMAEAAHD